MEKLIDINNQLMQAPAGVLIMFFTFMVGLALKKSKKVPNNLIPIVLLLGGCAIWMCFALAKFPTDSNVRTIGPWVGTNICIGFTLPGLTWILHRLVVKNIMAKFGMGDVLNGDDNSNPEAFRKPKE